MTKRLARAESDLLSVQGLVALLKGICSYPAKYSQDQALNTALKSQAALAKYQDSAASVYGMSLNHQKMVAEKLLGGYQVLDGLRRAALDALSVERHREKRGARTTKEELKIRVRELAAERLLLLEELMLLQRAYDRRCLHARQYAANADAATRTRCAKEQREIDVMLSIRRRPAPQSNVVAMDARRRK
jgi:hypothetical protein